MDLELIMGGDATAESDARDLQALLRREAVAGLHVQPKPGAPTPGHMGIDPVTVLTVILGSEAIIQLVKSLHVWLQTRKPKATVTVKTVAGEVQIDVENLKDQDAFVQRVLSVVHPG
jgi:hypothetical protein